MSRRQTALFGKTPYVRSRKGLIGQGDMLAGDDRHRAISAIVAAQGGDMPKRGPTPGDLAYMGWRAMQEHRAKRREQARRRRAKKNGQG